MRIAQLERLLAVAAGARFAATGRRDYAILLLLARLGLRRGEVASLGLDDIDWRAGELTVAGKNVDRDLRQGRRGFLAALGPAMARHDAPGRSL